MAFLELILIAIGLAMDCFSVSFSAGAVQNIRLKQILIVAFCFGIFQAIMPLIGWFCGHTVVDYICNFDHWIAFLILSIIGGKMLFDGIKGEENHSDIMKIRTLLFLSIATSIDALAVGFSFAMLKINLWSSIFIIGITSFLLSIIGVYAGKWLSARIKPTYAEIFGGVILLLIGIKILIEHLSA